MNEQKRGRSREDEGCEPDARKGEGSAHGRKEGLTQARRRARTSAKGSAGEGRERGRREGAKERGRIFSELLWNVAISI